MDEYHLVEQREEKRALFVDKRDSIHLQHLNQESGVKLKRSGINMHDLHAVRWESESQFGEKVRERERSKKKAERN